MDLIKRFFFFIGEFLKELSNTEKRVRETRKSFPDSFFKS
jgi:hypothetical protein